MLFAFVLHEVYLCAEPYKYKNDAFGLLTRAVLPVAEVISLHLVPL